MENAQKKESKHILGWTFGVLFLLTSLGMLTESFISFVATLALGLILLPPSRKWLENKIDRKLSRGVLISIGVVLLGITGAGLPTNSTEETKVVDSVENNEAVAVEEDNSVVEAEPVVETEVEAPAQEEANEQAGTNIPRSAFIDKFENVDYLNVTFAAATPVDGADNYTANDGNVAFQLIGPADNLEQASVWVFASPDDLDANTIALASMADFINAFDQSLNDDNWLLDEFDSYTPGTEYKSSIQRNGRNIRFEYEPTLGSFMVIVEPNNSTN